MDTTPVRPGRTRRNLPAGQAPADVQKNLKISFQQQRRIDIMADMLGISEAEFIRRTLDEKWESLRSRISMALATEDSQVSNK